MKRTVEVAETFVSIQGESTHAGRPCFFVRLAGCNLCCSYCDTPAARSSGVAVEIGALTDQYRAEGVAMAEITGGEPLLQPGFAALAEAMREAGADPLLVETNGSMSLAAVPSGVTAIMDIKCPGSGEAAAVDWNNVALLRPYDEVKFVIGDRADYEWARARVAEHRLADRCRAVHFSPVFGLLDAAELGRWLLADRLPVRLQIQLHRWLGFH